jgi:hypothetical protein
MFREQHIFDVAVKNLNALTDSMCQQRYDANPTIPAGFTYLGQFVDHDITFDPSSVAPYYFLISLPHRVGGRGGF